MDYSKIKDMLIRDEGLQLKPYLCPSGKLTIGIGRNIEDNGISKDEALYMLNNDIVNAERDCKNWLGKVYDNLSDTRKSVLINMMFNLGLPRLMGFKKFKSALCQGDFEKASMEMLDSRWAVQVGNRAERLAKLIS
jgi:lysozyme